MTNQGNHFEYLRDAQGRIVTDRFGRPVRARPRMQPPPQRPIQRPSRTDPIRPRQELPVQRPAIIPQPSRRLAPRRSPARRFFKSLSLILATIVVFSLVSVLWLDMKINRTPFASAAPIASTSGTNWLLVGSDSRAGLSEEEANRLGTGGDIGSRRTDTIMVMHIPLRGQATLVSIPRDSYVNIPGYGMDKINAAFTYGSAPLLTQTVEESTGLSIDHYAEIGMGGLAHVVDALGGIEVCPDQPIEDPLAQLNIGAGCQLVDGPTALGYVRTRQTAMGDLDRVQRQREFFSALVNKTTDLSIIFNPYRLIRTILTTVDSFTAGSGDHLWHLLRVAFAMRSGVRTETVPVGGFAEYDVGSVVLWDEAGATALFDSMR
ncbi:LCP family protein [Corynebacterium sp. ES2794-CONJ1]|uniref:LCP family protein n=1 Tax=Corynebacterium sp. ES2794-CONJ1 TaxID=2980553 RepID=UPI0021DB768D|nr:LCP family protein [Corynebacterium sp. ES2794-CONJ1]MCU9519579.1 LCP family protein [Corynebacterium sp. ES2794-CONJ1]